MKEGKYQKFPFLGCLQAYEKNKNKTKTKSLPVNLSVNLYPYAGGHEPHVFAGFQTPQHKCHWPLEGF